MQETTPSNSMADQSSELAVRQSATASTKPITRAPMDCQVTSVVSLVVLSRLPRIIETANDRLPRTAKSDDSDTTPWMA